MGDKSHQSSASLCEKLNTRCEGEYQKQDASTNTMEEEDLCEEKIKIIEVHNCMYVVDKVSKGHSVILLRTII